MKLPIALVAGLLAAACAPAHSNSGGGMSTAAVPDTIVGVVTEVGADPATWMSLQPSAGGASVKLTGTEAASLRAVSGAQVWLSGAQVADGFRVDVFEVRSTNGNPVDDGIVSVDGGRVMLRMRSGAVREVPDAPPAMRDLVGGRIWVTRPVANQSPSYGLIRRP